MRQWTANWWALGLRSAAAIVLGIIALTWPGATLRAIVTMFGIFAIIDGVFEMAAAMGGLKADERWFPMLIKGLCGVVAGGFALVWPGIGALGLVYLIAAWGLATGILEIVAGVRLRRVMDHEWMLIAAGVLSIVLAIGIAAYPGTGMVLLVWWLGAYALAYGVISLVVTVHVKQWFDDHPGAARI